MGLFDRIARGIGRGVGHAVENAAERKANEVVQDKVNEAADNIIQTSGEGIDAEKMAQAGAIAGANMNAANVYVAEMVKNMKKCPRCEEVTTSDKQFCPKCGTKLGDTIGASYCCKNCGKQNLPGEEFCGECGAKIG